MDKLILSLEPHLDTIMMSVGGLVAVAVIGLVAIKHMLYVCPPNTVLVFSGRKNKRGGGYRTIIGGRGWRIPIIEQVDAMDLTNISVPMTVTGAYSKGRDGDLGIPLSLHAVANIKISSDPRFIGNAMERFLGKPREELLRVAKENLEASLRGVLATMTPEEVNEDRLKFAENLATEAEGDLENLGLHLDTLKIQHVADEVEYLESIGRKRVAEVLRAAEVAESDAVRAAAEAEATAQARADVAETKAMASILQKTNELRQLKADLEAEAKSEEERALAAAEEARALAEKELQQIRGELEALRLAADVTIPAETERKVRELLAEGGAANIAADGHASAQALEAVSQAWSNAGGSAMDMHVLHNLEDLLARLVSAAKRLDVKEVNLIDGGDGSALAAYAAAYPATVGRLLGEVGGSIGVDLKGIVAGAAGNGVQNGTPAKPNQPSNVTL